MPCQCDYLEPNERENESRLVCKLLSYVLPKLSKSVPCHVLKGARDTYGNVDTVDADTALLCSVCKSMTKKQASSIMYDGRSAMARELAIWWDRHQEQDELREREERKAIRDAKLRERALSKLTPAERKVLELD